MSNPSPKIEAANDAPAEAALDNPLPTDDVVALAHQGANLTGMYALTHPSQPNYVALFSGGTQGVRDDVCPSMS